jgi:hypothetical protein
MQNLRESSRRESPDPGTVSAAIATLFPRAIATLLIQMFTPLMNETPQNLRISKQVGDIQGR